MVLPETAKLYNNNKIEIFVYRNKTQKNSFKYTD